MTSTTEQYRRQTRRLRHELRHDPVKLHRSLTQLAGRQDLAFDRPAVQSVTAAQVWRADSSTDHVQTLVAAVAKNMDGPILRYPARQELLRQARRLGLQQFDANLIISAVQHRMGERIVRQPRPARPWMRTLTIALIFQAWIIAGMYWLLVC
jgi:nucleotidyltransferase/DNA polymerase involved in DNA repair